MRFSLVVLVALFLTANTACSQADPGLLDANAETTVTLTVKVANAVSSDHRVYLGIQDETGQAVQQGEAELDNKTATFTFKSMPTGRYAIQVYHDENGNGKLDTGAFGIPQERYGFSNNAQARFGPPSLEERLFTLSANTKVIIEL
ncbi:MAG: DUF2141 domain-containing protein [Rhodothermales bacterium]